MEDAVREEAARAGRLFASFERGKRELDSLFRYLVREQNL